MTDVFKTQSFNHQARLNHARKMSQALNLQQALCAMLRICGGDPEWVLRTMRDTTEDGGRGIPDDRVPVG